MNRFLTYLYRSPSWLPAGLKGLSLPRSVFCAAKSFSSPHFPLFSLCLLLYSNSCCTPRSCQFLLRLRSYPWCRSVYCCRETHTSSAVRPCRSSPFATTHHNHCASHGSTPRGATGQQPRRGTPVAAHGAAVQQQRTKSAPAWHQRHTHPVHDVCALLCMRPGPLCICCMGASLLRRL